PGVPPPPLPLPRATWLTHWPWLGGAFGFFGLGAVHVLCATGATVAPWLFPGPFPFPLPLPLAAALVATPRASARAAIAIEILPVNVPSGTWIHRVDAPLSKILRFSFPKVLPPPNPQSFLLLSQVHGRV